MMYFRSMNFLTIKALHIIFVVTWFAGLFYMFRLFVYYAEAAQKDELEKSILQNQFIIMMKRLWYAISWPSAILALAFGLVMLIQSPDFLKMPYMHLKLGFVALLIVYQIYGELLLQQILKTGESKSSQTYRILNEVPTLFLIAIVFLIVLKNSFDWIWGSIGIIGVAIALSIAIKWYKRIREKS